MPVRFVLDSEGVREILRFPGVAAELASVADRVAGVARSIAPRDTGAYAASIGDEQAPSPKRARARVVADIPYALSVEARHLTLTTALGAGG